MRGHHDVGGSSGAHPVDRAERPLKFWERRVEAIRDCIARTKPPVMRVDEMRRAIEGMDAETYDSLTPHGRKLEGMRIVLVEKGVLSDALIERRMAAIRARRSTIAGDPLGVRHDDAHHHDHAAVEDADDAVGESELLAEAVYDGLVENGVVSAGQIREWIQAAERAGPEQGARVVARAWIDTGFRERLLADGKSAVAELGIKSVETKLGVIENTARVHNLVVCTLCSCYPRSVLGHPPSWYVSKAYRSRAIKEPRAVLAEFGTVIGDDVELRVHDSTADLRYLVLPLRPEGTEGWSEDRLAGLVTRDSLIGAAPARNP